MQPERARVVVVGGGVTGCSVAYHLAAAGRDHGIEPGGYRVLESLRMEKGYRSMGADISAGDTPSTPASASALDKGGGRGRAL